jgi:hypothetical protein
MKYSIKVKGDNNLNTEDVGRVFHALATRSLCYLPRSNSHTPFHSFPHHTISKLSTVGSSNGHHGNPLSRNFRYITAIRQYYKILGSVENQASGIVLDETPAYMLCKLSPSMNVRPPKCPLHA